jgi:hypothetical protein
MGASNTYGNELPYHTSLRTKLLEGDLFFGTLLRTSGATQIYHSRYAVNISRLYTIL